MTQIALDRLANGLQLNADLGIVKWQSGFSNVWLTSAQKPVVGLVGSYF